jgi:hypothetical protein
MPASLFKDLARTGWHSSIMTTYSVDPAFYDGSVEYRLRTYGCENNILMADAGMLKRALTATPEAFKNAGRRYAIVPVQARGAFHPKLHLRLGIDGARLIVGSANATAAGWGSNHEIVTAFDWTRKTEDDTVAALGPLIRRAYDYLATWLEAVPGGALDFKLRLHWRDSPWLADLAPNAQPIELPDGSAIDLMFERGGDAPGMLPRLHALISGEIAQRLIVISPYWDASLGGLRELQRGLNRCATVVALNPALNEFPVTALDASTSTTFAAIRDGDDGRRFLHAKIIVIQTEKADHVLFGSANCSDDAMGGAEIRARNAEVSVYRRFPPGAALSLLDLDLSRIIDASAIAPPHPDKQPAESDGNAVPAGAIEIVEKSLTWWPPSGSKPAGAHIIVAGQEAPTAPIGNGQFRAELTGELVYPLVARVRFSDGRVSDPVIIHDETALRIAAPGVTDRRLRNAFNRVMRGEEDLIDLALQAHLLFAQDENAGNRPGHATNKGRGGKQQDGKDYATPEAFRAGVALRLANGQSGYLSLDDPGLLDLLNIVLHGVTDLGGRDARRRQDEEEDEELEAGENEDGDEQSTPQETAKPMVPSGEPKPGVRSFSSAQIERRKNQLKKAISAFEAMLEALAKGKHAVTTRLTAQTAFILNLMLFACIKDHETETGSSVKLMTFAPQSGVDRKLTFAVSAGRILQAIWIGGSSGAVIDKLEWDHRLSSMPDDVFFLIVMSRWAVARAWLATMESASKDGLGKILQALAVKLYQSSARFGPLDADAEHAFIAKLDAALGFGASETERLVRDCRKFAAQVTLNG